MSEPVVSSKDEKAPKADKKEEKKNTTENAVLDDELKILVDEGVAFEQQLMLNPELADNDAFEDQVEGWESKVKGFRKQGGMLTKSQEQILKYLKKKAESLCD